MQVLLCKPHVDEGFPSENICGAAIVDKDSTYVVSCEVDRISANVGTDDKGIVVWIVLKPEVGFGKCDWDMGPRGAEMFAFAYVRDCAEYSFLCHFISCPCSLDPLEMALMTFTMPPTGSLALSGTVPGPSFGGGGR